MKALAFFVLVVSSMPSLLAVDAIHRVDLKSCDTFEVLSPTGIDSFSVYPLSEGMRKVAQGGSRKTVEAADYAVGVRIRAKDPQRALQGIVRQIYESTGRPLAKFTNGSLAKMAPSTMLIAMDADSVWCLVLSPKEEPDTYVLACGYVIDRKKEANKAPEPTPTSVTSPAAQEPRQP